MFKGTTPKEVKVILKDILGNVKNKDIFIGCSGNFTTDKIVDKMGFRVHSNDVSLYSKLISDILLGSETEVKVLDNTLRDVFSYWEDSKFKKLIQVMYVMRISDFKDLNNDYKKIMFNEFLEKGYEYYNVTKEKLGKGAFDFRIKDFSFFDFLDFLKLKKGKGVGICFPPTYKAGYEKMFKNVEESFNYERANYSIFDPSKGGEIFGELLDQDENIIYADRFFPELKSFEQGKIIVGSGRKSLYVYSSVYHVKNYYIDKLKGIKPSKLRIIDKDFNFNEKSIISIEDCKVSDVNYYKDFYMAAKVNYTTGGDIAFVAKADGMVFGFLVFNRRLSNLYQLCLQADFVSNCKQKKLSKLLILITKSSELRNRIARITGNFYKGMKTTVYTDKPVSMKYRGAWTLRERCVGKLIYETEFEEEFIYNIYLSWLKKYKSNKSGKNLKK